MARAATRLVVAMYVVWATGCGTVSNIWFRTPKEGAAKMYGGTKMDVEVGQQAWSGAAQSNGLASFAEGVGIATLCTLDLPFSVVGDTLTLPATWWAELGEALHYSDRPENDVPPPTPTIVASFPFRVTSAKTTPEDAVWYRGGSPPLFPDGLKLTKFEGTIE